MALFLAQSSQLGALAIRPCFGGQTRLAPQQAKRVIPRASATDRDVWYPGNAPPEHLDGSLPGDYGFDPLGFSDTEDRKIWMQQAELIHARICMTAAAGILFPAIANAAGAGKFPAWYDAGKVWIDTHPAFPFPSMLFVQFLLVGWVESKRWADLKNPGSQGDGSFLGITDGLKGVSNGYPGGIFDPFGYSRGDSAKFEEYKVKEIKNGRLAILACLGFAAQYAATGTDPITNLSQHLASPFTVNFTSNGVSLPFVK